MALPFVYGVRKAAWLMARFFVLPWLLLPLGARMPDPQNPRHAILTGNPTLLTIMGILFTIWGAYTVYPLVRGPQSLTETENHPAWKHFYLKMMGAQAGLALACMF